MPLTNLLAGLDELATAPLACLRNAEWLAGAIRRTGLCGEADGYSPEDRAACLGKQEGIFQRPAEMAAFLVSMAGERIASYLEVGAWAGWNAAFTTTYLRRFVPDLTAMTIDPAPRFDPGWPLVAARTGLRHFAITSRSLAGRPFDLVFIDADHSYAAVEEDYANVGRHARICAFHDIQDQWVKGQHPCGGSVAFWESVRQDKKHVEHRLPPEPRWMGIGVLYQGQPGIARLSIRS